LRPPAEGPSSWVALKTELHPEPFDKFFANKSKENIRKIRKLKKSERKKSKAKQIKNVYFTFFLLVRKRKIFWRTEIKSFLFIMYNEETNTRKCLNLPWVRLKISRRLP
jgi:hypothetical protein